MSSSNVLFCLMMSIGPLVSISASSWIVCWAGIEISSFGLLPLLFKSSSLAKESVLKYFCIQALASAFLFLSGMMIFSFIEQHLVYMVGMMGSLCLKLGLFPGHFWVPSVIFGLDWIPCCLILGPMKIGPLAFLTVFSEFEPQVLMLFLGGLSALIGAFLGNNQTNMRSMIAASSISHTGWMMLGAVFGGLWIYVIIYFMVLFLVLLFISSGKYMGTSLSILSMSGLPPFIMFLAKLSIITETLDQGGSFSMLILPLSGALLSLIFYLKFSYSFYLLSIKYHESALILYVLLVINLVGVLWFLLNFFGGRD